MRVNIFEEGRSDRNGGIEHTRADTGGTSAPHSAVNWWPPIEKVVFVNRGSLSRRKRLLNVSVSLLSVCWLVLTSVRFSDKYENCRSGDLGRHEHIQTAECNSFAAAMR